MTQTCLPNYTPLNPNEFRFLLHRAPYLSFEVQTVALPSISLYSARPTETPFTTIAVPGDHIEWDQLSVVFLVDENLTGWQEMFDWMRGLGFPTTFDEYMHLRRDGDNKYKSVWEAVMSDISVFTATSHRNSNLEFKFYDAFPTMISAPTLSTTNDGQPVVTSKCMFNYTTYDITPIRVSA